MPSRAKWKKCLQFHPLSYAFLLARVFIPWKSSAFCCGVFISTRTTFESNHKLISLVFHSNEVGVERVRSSSAVFASFGMLDCSSQGLPEAWYFFRALVPRCSRLKSSEKSMTSSVENDPDALKICPYDPVHKVKAKRFPYHLEKCRKVRKSNITEFLALTLLLAGSWGLLVFVWRKPTNQATAHHILV